MKLFTTKDISIKEGMHRAIKTGTILDDLFSVKKGIMASSITMVPGVSGIGKTTVCIDILKTAQICDPNLRTLFISVEMNKIHLYRYSKRLNFTETPIFIFDLKKSISQQFVQILDAGWDLVFIDSFQQLVNIISVYDKISVKQAEIFVIKTMDNCRLGNNRKKIYTAFLATMHTTKTNKFAGSAYIKFMVDAMLELRIDEEDRFLRYMVFTKNRDGKTNRRLYYSISEHGVEYNLSKYKEDEEIEQELKRIREQRNENYEIFDNLFNND